MEFALIDSLKSLVPVNARVPLGIGDDCALLTPPPGQDVLITTDLLLDGVHFLSQTHSLEWIARKSLAVSVSDIAAMAGEPVAVFISLAIPRHWQSSRATQLMHCLAAAARELNITIAGGDTTTWNAPLAINSTLYGHTPRGKAVQRKGARPGDLICVSGPLGGSLAEHQFTFTPRTREALWLNEHCHLTAMLDLSDGLSSDLPHLLQASQVGAVVYLDRIPISAAAAELRDSKSPLEHALSDGEDFELLWTMPPSDWEKIQHLTDCPVHVFPIGEIVPGSDCQYLDAQGNPVPLNPQGYVHSLHPEN